MIDWTYLHTFTEEGFDTPELVKEREAVNKEIGVILEKRASIDAALAIVKNTPVDQLTVTQIREARKAKEEHFNLLKRELQLRKTLIPDYFNRFREAAKTAAAAQNRKTDQLEAEVREGLEQLGYTPFSHSNPGGYHDAMIRGNSRVAESLRISRGFSHHAHDYDNTRDNRTLTEVVERELNNVMRQLVGVSNGIETSTATQYVAVNGIG